MRQANSFYPFQRSMTAMDLNTTRLPPSVVVTRPVSASETSKSTTRMEMEKPVWETYERESKFGEWIRVDKVVRYVFIRQNADGGYSFAQGGDSSVEDTYYGVRILGMLGVKPLNKDRTVAFLKRMQHGDGSYDSVKVAYYAVKTLKELGSKPERAVKKFVYSMRRRDGGYGSREVDVETSSELETTYIALKLLKLLEAPLKPTATKFILSLKNPDGSFGHRGYSRLASTYHALACLKLLEFDGKFEDTLRWILGCENPKGGFARSPEVHDPYFVVDDLYYAVKALEILGEPARYPVQHLRLIGKFQNRNGGFRRSIFIGISTFESTYYALSSLKTLLTWM
ncbi:MAG: prenyltransferase/squalene oxidase repeat-containing protein [Candidatus Bathyarchaeia archaeon]